MALLPIVVNLMAFAHVARDEKPPPAGDFMKRPAFLGLVATIATLCTTPAVLACDETLWVGDFRPAPGKTAAAVAIRGQMVSAVYDAAALAALDPDPSCTKTLPEGSVAFAGLTDSHAHLLGIGLREMDLNLEGTTSVAMLKRRIAEAAKGLAPGEPLIGRGWIETGWPEGRMPLAADLDEVVADRPVILGRADGHAAVVNTAAMRAVGIDADTPSPDGGRILHRKDGAPNGLLIDSAMGLVADLKPALTLERRREALIKGARTYADLGWTGMHNMSVDWADVAILEELAATGQLPLRVHNYVVPEAQDDLIASGPRCAADKRVCTPGVKYYIDGALGSRGAYLFAPYNDDRSTSGLLMMRPSEAREAFGIAHAAGLQVVTHAIGDKGNRTVLDVYRHTLYENQITDHRWRIEHAQILRRDDIKRFAEEGVIASMQPSHAIGDLFFAMDRLGKSRLRGAYAWRSLIDAGVMVVGGSDAPVERGDPRIELHAATRRFALNGFEDDHWHAEEALLPAQALALFTTHSAFAVRMEDELGVLEPGYRADISVLSADPFTTPWDEVTPLMTFIDGVVQ